MGSENAIQPSQGFSEISALGTQLSCQWSPSLSIRRENAGRPQGEFQLRSMLKFQPATSLNQQTSGWRHLRWFLSSSHIVTHFSPPSGPDIHIFIAKAPNCLEQICPPNSCLNSWSTESGNITKSCGFFFFFWRPFHFGIIFYTIIVIRALMYLE